MPGIDPRASGVLRQGPFWDVLAGRRDPPPAAVLLGWELVAVDPDAGTIEVSFAATEKFTDPQDNMIGLAARPAALVVGLPSQDLHM